MYKDKEYLYEEFIVKRKFVRDIAKDCNVSISTVENYLKRYGLKRGNIKYNVDESKFSKNFPEFCYYAGLVSTDGYLSKGVARVSVRCKNLGCKEVFENLKAFFSYSGEIKCYRECYDLSITSHKLREELSNMGVSSEGKINNSFPSSFYSEDCARMFFRGLLDGDGNIKTSKVFRITLSNRSYLEGFSSFLNSYLGLSTVVKPDRKYWKIEMLKGDSLIFLSWVYQGFPSYRFLDKYYRWLE